MNPRGVAFSADSDLYRITAQDVHKVRLESAIEAIHAFHEGFTPFFIEKASSSLRWHDCMPKFVPANQLANSYHTFDIINPAFSIISSFDIKQLIVKGNLTACVVSGLCENRIFSDFQINFKARPNNLTFTEEFETIREKWTITEDIPVETPKKEEEKYPEEIAEEERLRKKHEPVEKQSIYKELPEDISKPIKMQRKPITDFESLKKVQKEIRDKISAQNAEAHKGLKAQQAYNKWDNTDWWERRDMPQPDEVKHYALNTTALKEEYEQTQKMKSKLKKEREVAKKEKVDQRRKGGKTKGKFEDYD
jgi:hypothetical protein